MPRRYYSSRKHRPNLTLGQLYLKLQYLYLFFRDKDYFKEKAGITKHDLPETIKHEAYIELTFQPFPVTKWEEDALSADRVFDLLQFLYDRISRPGAWGEFVGDSGFTYSDYREYDTNAGQNEFRQRANIFLSEYQPGFEMTEQGEIVELGADGLQFILNADIIPYDEVNVDSKVRNAIGKWRKRRATREEKKEAIRELADVFEWLKKTKRLTTAFDSKDESAIFDLANNFAIRHHNPNQKTNYDKEIWFSWIFHFYLATYHAAIRLLLKKETTKKQP